MPYNVASDHGLHCLLTGFFIKNGTKLGHIIRPNTPKVTNGLIQHITVEESTSIQWVSIVLRVIPQNPKTEAVQVNREDRVQTVSAR